MNKKIIAQPSEEIFAMPPIEGVLNQGDWEPVLLMEGVDLYRVRFLGKTIFVIAENHSFPEGRETLQHFLNLVEMSPPGSWHLCIERGNEETINEAVIAQIRFKITVETAQGVEKAIGRLLTGIQWKDTLLSRFQGHAAVTWLPSGYYDLLAVMEAGEVSVEEVRFTFAINTLYKNCLSLLAFLVERGERYPTEHLLEVTCKQTATQLSLVGIASTPEEVAAVLNGKLRDHASIAQAVERTLAFDDNQVLRSNHAQAGLVNKILQGSAPNILIFLGRLHLPSLITHGEPMERTHFFRELGRIREEIISSVLL